MPELPLHPSPCRRTHLHHTIPAAPYILEGLTPSGPVLTRVCVSLFQGPDGQAGGRGRGPGRGELLLRGVWGRRRRGKDGAGDRPAAQPAQLHHRQRPHR